MKDSTKVYLVIFLIIAVTAFVLSTAFASVFVIDNSNSKKLTAIENDSFEPHTIEDVPVIVQPVENTTNTTTTNNNTTWSNWTEDIIEIADDTWNSWMGD